VTLRSARKGIEYRLKIGREQKTRAGAGLILDLRKSGRRFSQINADKKPK
jgi:hypothetical protein